MRPSNRNPARQRGFSLIEMLVASFLLLLVVVGLVPLFVQSIKSNETAEETSDLLRAAQLQMEGLIQLPFNDSALEVQKGDRHGTTKHSIPATSAYKLAVEDVAPDPSKYRNQPVDSEVTIRYFNIAAIDDGVLDENDALASDPGASNLVHFKQIVMEVRRSEYSFGLPIGKSEIQMIKAN